MEHVSYSVVQLVNVVHNMDSKSFRKIRFSKLVFCMFSCGATPEHCQGVTRQGDCQTTGCPNGLCCSKFGYCGNTPEHCDNTSISNGNCKTLGCPPGQCCSVHGL